MSLAWVRTGLGTCTGVGAGVAGVPSTGESGITTPEDPGLDTAHRGPLLPAGPRHCKGTWEGVRPLTAPRGPGTPAERQPRHSHELRRAAVLTPAVSKASGTCLLKSRKF